MKTLLLTIAILLTSFTTQAKVSIIATVSYHVTETNIIQTELELDTCKDMESFLLNSKFVISQNYKNIIEKDANETLLLDKDNQPVDVKFVIEPNREWQGMSLKDTVDSSLIGFVDFNTGEHIALECNKIPPSFIETVSSKIEKLEIEETFNSKFVEAEKTFNLKFKEIKEYLWKL